MIRIAPVRPVLCLAWVAAMSSSVSPAAAQGLPVRDHPYIAVPHNVLSVRTDSIRAQAQYLQAMGDYQESIGIARIYHAQAAEMEIRNHAEWVKTYFELKELNKAYYLKEHPPFIDRQARIQQVLRSRHVRNPHLDLEGDISDETLNWYLHELGATVQAAGALGARRADGFADEHLSAREVSTIVLADGARRGNVRAVFHADEARALDTKWPFILLAPEFEADRTAFERARETAVQEMAQQQAIRYETGLELKESTDRLRFSLERLYPKQRRANPKDWQDYQTSLLFINGLALAIDRVNAAQDGRLFDGSLRFRGDTVSDLIRHMCSNGLEFAPAGPDGQPTYRKLYLAMRDIWFATNADLQ
jgi:hypothetical protein